MMPSLPEHVGPYDLRRVIGTGGTATVYLADRRDGPRTAPVALKLVHAHLRGEKQIAADLLEEAKLTARIRHPKVVSVLDYGEDPAGTYLVLEFVDGLPLADLLPDGATAPDPRLGLAALSDALEGLHAAHELRDPDGQPVGLVHRDFTPHNILVGVDGRAKLSDFGIAKAQIRSNTTKQGFVKGKAAYMAPEQIRGKGIDRRCDIWAAGVVAWEIFAGRRLYSADDINAMFRIVAEDPPRLRTVNGEVPQRVEDVVARALSRNAQDRFATADAFRVALLEAWTAHAPIATHDEVGRAVRAGLAARSAAAQVVEAPPLAPAPPAVAPRRWLALGGALLLALGLAGALVVALRPVKAPGESSRVVAAPPPPPSPAPPPRAPVLVAPPPVEPTPPEPAEVAPEKPHVVTGTQRRPKPPPTLPPPAAVEPAPPPAAPLAGNPYEKER
jgi:hypothetical protein